MKNLLEIVINIIFLLVKNFLILVWYLSVVFFNFFWEKFGNRKEEEKEQYKYKKDSNTHLGELLNARKNLIEEFFPENKFKDELKIKNINESSFNKKDEVTVFTFFLLFVFKFIRYLLIRFLNILSNVVLFNVKLIYILFEGFDSKHLKNVPDIKNQLFGDFFISENPFKFYFSGQWVQPPKVLGKLMDLSSAIERSKLFKSVISNEDKKSSFRFYLWKQKRDDFYIFSYENYNFLIEFKKDSVDSRTLWFKYYSKLVDFSFNEKISNKLILENLCFFFRDREVFFLQDDIKVFLKHFDIFFTLFDFLNEKKKQNFSFLPSTYLSLVFLVSFWLLECSFVRIFRNIFIKLTNLVKFGFFHFIKFLFFFFTKVKIKLFYLFFLFKSFFSNVLKFMIIFIYFYKNFNLLKIMTFKSFFSSINFVKESVFVCLFFFKELTLKQILKYFIKDNLRLFFFNLCFFVFSFIYFFLVFFFFKLRIYFKSILWFPLILIEYFFLVIFFFLFGKRVFFYLQIYIRRRNLIFPYFPQVFNLGEFYTHFLAQEGDAMTPVGESSAEEDTGGDTNFNEEGDFDSSFMQSAEDYKNDPHFFNSYEFYHKLKKRSDGEKSMFDIIKDYSIDDNENEDNEEAYLRTSFFYTMLKGFWSGLVSFFKYIISSIYNIFTIVLESKILSYSFVLFIFYFMVKFWSSFYVFLFEFFFFFNL